MLPITTKGIPITGIILLAAGVIPAQEVKVLNVPEQRFAAYLADGKTFMSAGRRNDAAVVILWDAHTTKEIRHFKSGNSSICAISPKGDMAAGFERFKSCVELVDIRNMKIIRTLKPAYWPLAFSPDGKVLATGFYEDGKDIGLWDVATGKLLGGLKGQPTSLHSIVFSPDGKKLFTADRSDHVKGWDVTQRKLLFVIQASDKGVLGKECATKELTVSPDGRTLLAVGYVKGPSNCSLHVIDIGKGKIEFSLVPFLNPNAMKFSPDGKFLALDRGNDLVVLDTQRWQWHAMLKRSSFSVIESVNWSPDGKSVVTTGETAIKIWNIPKEKKIEIGRAYTLRKMAP